MTILSLSLSLSLSLFLIQSSQENDSSEGSPAKNYVLHADSEEDMVAWIKALSEEMKPMIGEDRHVNGFSGGKTGSGGTRASPVNSSGGSSGTPKGKGKKGKGGELTVDNKALDQVNYHPLSLTPSCM